MDPIVVLLVNCEKRICSVHDVNFFPEHLIMVDL